MKNKKGSNKSHSGGFPTEIINPAPYEMPLPILADKIERGEIECPDGITRINCVGYLKSKGYSYNQIAIALHLSARTVIRCMKVYRRDHAIVTSPDFQSETVGDMVRLMDNESERLIKLSYEKNLSPSEQAKLILAGCHVKKAKMEVLIGSGYLSKELALISMRQSVGRLGGNDSVFNCSIPRFNELTQEQQWLICHIQYRQGRDMLEMITKLVDDCIKENSQGRENDKGGVIGQE